MNLTQQGESRQLCIDPKWMHILEEKKKKENTRGKMANLAKAIYNSAQWRGVKKLDWCMHNLKV